MVKNKLFEYILSVPYICSLCICALLNTPVVHASLPCADLISSSSTPSPSFSSFSSKEQSASTDFESGSSEKDVLSLSSSSKSDTFGSSSQNIFDFYANSKIPKEGTKNFQSYIGELLEKQIIKEPQFTRFIEGLEKGELMNPISKDEALTSTALLVQRKGLQKYLDQSSLNQKELLDWSRATLEERARVRVKRGEAREETRYQRLEFHPVKRPVRFEVNKHKRLVTLTYPIEVQSTLVTQKQWVEVMGENPSYFAKGENSVVLNFHGKDIELQPDNPVENVTWWSAIVFANRLSEKHGLPPAYDLSDVNLDLDTRPENGTLKPAEGLHRGDEVRIYAKGKSHDPSKGDIYYRSEGYRLPTTAEQIYMLRGGENMKDHSFFKNEVEMKAHAWSKGNSDGRTHPVGLLQAMVIDGKEFYDLYGNVWEFGWDLGPSEKGSVDKYGERNPIYPVNLEFMDLRSSIGGGFGVLFSQSHWLPYFMSRGKVHTAKDPDAGFRLVRTIEQGDGE